jgi:hypothetical protein
MAATYIGIFNISYMLEHVVTSSFMNESLGHFDVDPVFFSEKWVLQETWQPLGTPEPFTPMISISLGPGYLLCVASRFTCKHHGPNFQDLLILAIHVTYCQVYPPYQ